MLLRANAYLPIRNTAVPKLLKKANAEAEKKNQKLEEKIKELEKLILEQEMKIIQAGL